MTEYSFVDMHIHTEFSDEELCDMTIEQLLEKAQKKALIAGKVDCVISITDHNSILGVKKAREILKRDGKTKYPNVKLINGIEFTTDLTELSKEFGGERVFTRCHTLAYGYNENDAELTAYSKVAHMHFSKDDNIGMQICAARRAICERYNINIPFAVFEPMTLLDRGANFRDVFLQLVKVYAKKNNISISKNEVEKLINPLILNSVDYVREASSLGRLKLSEIAQIVKNAGGEIVIAHPSLIRVTTKGLQYIAKKEKVPMDSLYLQTSKKYGNNTDLGHVKNQKLLLNYFLDAFESICGYKINGIEKYYSINFSSRLDKVIEETCQERGMYETCGSDYHGEHLHPDKSVGNVLHDDLQKVYKQQQGITSPERAPICVSAISSVEHLLNTSNPEKNKTILKIQNGKVVNPVDFENACNTFAKVTNTPKRITESLAETAKIKFSDRIAELIDIVRRFDEIIANADSPRKQAKLMLRLNLFAENIVSGLDVLRCKSSTYEYMRTLDEYKQIVDLLEDINNKYNVLLRHNPLIIKDLKHDMRYYYKKKNISITKIAKLSLLPPIIKQQEAEREK